MPEIRLEGGPGDKSRDWEGKIQDKGVKGTEKPVDVILEVVVRIHFVACTRLYTQLCLSVGPFVGLFVH